MTAPYYATRPHDLASRETLLAMSGLAFMQGVLEGRIPGPPIGQQLNYHLHSVEKGRVAFRGTPLFEYCNPMGTVHGGWYGTLLDSCMACAVMTMVPQGSVYTTMEYKVNITRAIPLGTEVEAIGTIQHAGRKSGVSNGEIRGLADGKLYATGSTTCTIMTPD